MTLDPQIQPIANHILSAALQTETVEEGLNLIYEVIITWAWQVSLDAVFAFNESRLDQGRSEETRQAIPAREYLNLWTVAKLRAGPVYALNERLMARDYSPRDYQPQPAPLPAGAPASLSAAEIDSYARGLAGSLSIEQALELFESLLVQYASLVSHEKVRHAMEPVSQPETWTDESAFLAVFTLLYGLIIDPISDHGLWQVRTAAAVPSENTAQPEVKKSYQRPVYRSFYESDPPDVIFRQRLAPEVLKAYQEAAYALVHYRIVHERGMFGEVGPWLTLPQLPGLLNDFETLSLTGDGAHWAQPVPKNDDSLRATSLLLLAGIAAPALLLKVNIDPLNDPSPTGQTILHMLDTYLYEIDDSLGAARFTIIQLYQAAEKEIKAYWNAVDRVAKRLLEARELSKTETYQIFKETGRGWF